MLVIWGFVQKEQYLTYFYLASNGPILSWRDRLGELKSQENISDQLKEDNKFLKIQKESSRRRSIFDNEEHNNAWEM